MNRSRVALVTGCRNSDGIGAATARILAASGARVMICDLDRDGLDQLVAEIVDSGGEAEAASGDVSIDTDAAALVRATVARFGTLDILVNNAAAPHGPESDVSQNVPGDAMRYVMAVNVIGPLLMIKAAAPVMIEQEWGRIVSVSSIAALRARPRNAVYSASKAAVLGLTRSIALDMAPHKVTVNAVCPGRILTRRTLIGVGATEGVDDVDAALRTMEQSSPMLRSGQAEEVAAAIAFLSSEAASFITGQAVQIDGGEFS